MEDHTDAPADLDLLAGETTTVEETGGETSGTETDTTTEGGTTETGDAGETAGDAGESEAAGKEGDEAPKGEEGEKPRRPSGAERARRRIAALEAENASLRAAAPAAGDADALARAVEAEIGKPPEEKDFPDFMAYERALTAYETEKRIVSREVKGRAAAQATQAEAAHAERLEDFRDRCAETAKAIPDFAAVMQAAVNGPKLGDAVIEEILESEKGDLIAYHLAKNPREAERLSALPAKAVAREIGRLEATLSLPKPKTVTAAPKPVAPVRGAPAAGPDPSKMTQAQYEAWRSKGGGR